MSPAPDGGYDLVAEGSLGHGSGHERAGGGGLVRSVRHDPDPAGRPSVECRVQETVELLSKKKGREVPFMKIAEEGLVYRPVRP
jgi:hypothetical protein